MSQMLIFICVYCLPLMQYKFYFPVLPLEDERALHSVSERMKTFIRLMASSCMCSSRSDDDDDNNYHSIDDLCSLEVFFVSHF